MTVNTFDPSKASPVTHASDSASKTPEPNAVAAPSSELGNRVGFVSLGCPKALVDSERILTQLKLDGYDVVPSYNDADVVVDRKSVV